MQGNRRFRSSGRSFSGKGKSNKKEDTGRGEGNAPSSKRGSSRSFGSKPKFTRDENRPGRSSSFKKQDDEKGEKRFPGTKGSRPGPRKFSGGAPKGAEKDFRPGKSSFPPGVSKGPRKEDGPRESGFSKGHGKGATFKRYARDERPREKKSFVESRLDRQRKQTREPSKAIPQSGDDKIRLNRFIANSGVCSRREADDLISMGLITVNGQSITELGYKVKISDDVRYEGKRLKAEKPVYILLNKPKGFITTTDDPQDRNTVMNLIAGACKQRVYPVGRLDRNTSGLLLLTNDGDLTEKLTHPSHNVKKIYKAELDRPLTKNDFQKVLEGVRLEEGKAVVDDLAIVSEDGKTVGLEIHIGWNRLVRRIFESLGYEVVKLDRSVYATLDKKELSRGHWRFLKQEEVVRLKHFQ